ncbi:ATP-binding protein [Nocardioides sp.]|uniref:ATP-binding protein n=1 Tax=Nocardioides sp. TaxID=35761 RepID=UPI0026311961|nr:ATP-binding protein [Nocardioides sp.]MCW2736306.1 Signal transduction histidine kinase [Nocardioides sp.]
MSRPAPLPLRWTLGFALAYAALAVLARLTVRDGQAVSLVWPGAGVAMLWLLAESPRRAAWVLVPLTVIHAGVAGFTNAPAGIVVLGAVSLACQTWVTVLLLRRWCPTLLGAGGTESFRSPRSLAYTCLAAALGSAVGALIGSLGVWLHSGVGWNAWVPQAWFARHFAGILVVGCVGHLAWEWRTSPVAPRTRAGSRREFVVMWAVSVLVVLTVFLQPLPLVFLVMSLCVWSAARFPTYLAALHALALGVGGLLLTLGGLGPSDVLDDPVQKALVGQLFLVAVLLTGLGVGTLSDRIDELVVRMGEARARAAEQAELLAEMTESMDEGLIVLDREGRIERSNGASRRLAHRVSPGAADAVALANLVQLVLHPDAAHTSATRAELGAGDVLLPLGSGDDLVLAVSRAVLASQRGDDGRSGVLLVLQEVTEHRKGLQPLVGFASTAAHDLRGPLTAIRAWLDLAAVDLADDSDTLASIKRAELASVQMAGLIDDLLAQAVAEAGDLEVHDVELCGPDGAVVQAAALLGPDDVLEVSDDGLPSVHADEVALRQLFANLVGNAVKYARPGVPARILVRAQRLGSRVVVEVEDNGVGVDEHERALIFQRFHRGDTVRAGLRGTGMGLAICQTIVQRHGGSIECLAADSGQGSVFRFDLPAAKVEPVSLLPTPPAPLHDEELATA